MNFEEKTVDSTVYFEGKVIKMKVDTVVLPTGDRATRELVNHPGGVGIIAIDNDNFVYMVRQYRKPYEEMVFEIPAGKLNYGEDPFECGKRELKEETGVTAENFDCLGVYYPTPGFCDEKITLYLATNLQKGNTNPDEDEFLEVEKHHIDDLYNMVMNNEIHDAKTAIAILKAYNIVRR